jgi:Terpene synthase family 2, C-terminal metal binding
MSIDIRPSVSHSIVLRYPTAWGAPRNPHASAVARRVESFLRRNGVLAGPDGQRLFERLDVAGYAGWPFPCAGREELTTIASFLTLWIYYDDVVEERGEQDVMGMERAVRGDSSQGALHDPCHRAFLELGRRFRSAMSPVWVGRHAARTIEWLRSVSDEARLAAALRASGRSPLARDFLPVRLVSVGARPVFCWVEYMTGTELPEVALADERVHLIERCAVEVIASVNELMAWSKDREARWPNLVDAVAEEERLTPARAFACVAAKHNARVDEMAGAMDDLRADRALGPIVADWVRAMGHITLGLARWHEGAPRYRTRQDVGNGQEVNITIELTRGKDAFRVAA